MQHLKARHPDLPGITEALRAAASLEIEEEAKATAAREEAARLREERALKRSRARREAMAAVLQDFQVRHDLTGDQLEAMWLRIVEEERSL